MTTENVSQVKKVVLILSQALWHILYLNMCTIWRDIPVIPRYADVSEILDKSRWFWLMNAPDPSVQDGLLILSLVTLPALAEFLFCAVWVCLHLKKWKASSVATRILYVTVILFGLIISVLFELQMYSNFINMVEYFYLWQREFHTEVFAIVVFLFALIGFISRRYPRFRQPREQPR